MLAITAAAFFLRCAVSFRTRIVRMGKTRVVRLPKELLDRAKIPDDGDVDIDFEGGRLVVRPAFKPRSPAAARRMLKSGSRE